jgi:hypothetical protein
VLSWHQRGARGARCGPQLDAIMANLVDCGTIRGGLGVVIAMGLRVCACVFTLLPREGFVILCLHVGGGMIGAQHGCLSFSMSGLG